MTEVLHRPFFSLKEGTGIVARKGNALFLQVIHEPTTFFLDVQNEHRVRLEATVYPSSPEDSSYVVFQTGGVLVPWKGKGARGDDRLEIDEKHRRHELIGDKGSLIFAPATSPGPDDISGESLHVEWGVPVTVVKFRSREVHLPFALPQIVYSFFSPPRE